MKRTKIKKFILLAGVLCVLGTAGFATYKTYAFFANKIELQKNKKAEAKRQEEERIEEERLQKEAEEEKKRKKVGVGPTGEAYSYDSKIIWDKLNKYDYSNNGEKIAFLTFDDGPSSTVTPKVLDILEKNDIKGTFFVVGKQLENEDSQKLLQRIYDEGHAIANHSYTHNYSTLYPNKTLNLSNFMDDINKTQSAIQEVLGENFSTNVVRCPGGFMSWKGMSALKEELESSKMSSIDWTSLNGDAEGKKKTPSQLLERAISTSKNKDLVVMLMHDTYGKENTAEMLDDLIKHLKSEGYTFKTLV